MAEQPKDITLEDVEAIKHHRLFHKGTSIIPARFWKYALVNTERPYDIDVLLKNGYTELDVEAAVKRHDGVSYSLLVN